MTVETVVLLSLIALWVLPPVLIVLWLRYEVVQDGLSYLWLLSGKTVRAITARAQADVVEPIQITFGEQAKAQRLELIEQDLLRVEIRELRKDLDLAELKANEYRMRVKDPSRNGPRKQVTKKAIRLKEKQRQRKKNKGSASTEQQEEVIPLSSSASSSSLPEPQSALLVEDLKIEELNLKISDLQLKLDQLVTAATLKEAQASQKKYEDLLSSMGCVKELTHIKEMEIAVDEKVARMRAVASAHRDVVFQDPPPTSRMTPERFRELIEQEKLKILEKRAKLPTKEELETTEKFSEGINRVFNVRKKISDFIARVDPDSDRVFERMRSQFGQAMRAHHISKQNEIKLETSVEEVSEKIVVLTGRIAGLDPSRAMTLISTRTTLEASVVDLEATLNSLRRKNKANELRLFEVASVIERLYLIRSMLAILPVTLRDTLESLTQIVNAGYSILLDDTLGNGAIHYIEDRLAKLEHTTMMAFIKIAKGDTKILKGRELAQLKERLDTAAAALMLEREELNGHKERWEAAFNSVEEDQPELRANAMYRRDHYVNLLQTINQSLDVISILSRDSSPKTASKAEF